MLNEIIKTISSVTKIPVDKISADDELMNVIAESFVMVEVMLALQEDFPVEFVQQDLDDVVTIGDLARLVEQKLALGEQ